MYTKRTTIGKFWPVERKGNKYLSTCTHEKRKSIPLCVVLRNILKVVRNKKELKLCLNDNKILVNNKVIKETNYPIMLFDIISIPLMKKNYIAILKKNKLNFREAENNEVTSKIYRVIGKKIMKKNKIQINLSNGKNLKEEKTDLKTGEFVIFDNLKNKIIKKIILERGSKILVIKGKHMGSYGKILDTTEQFNKKIAEIKVDETNEIIKVDVNNLWIIV